jgi:N-dimethylarginine dimethylaminohydrolase
MYHIVIKPTTFGISNNLLDQHPFGKKGVKIDRNEAFEQHKNVIRQLPKLLEFTVKKNTDVPDLVFMASAGLSLPRLPEPVVILPWMKFSQRRDEIIYKKQIFNELRVKTIDFPGNEMAPFEGQVEVKWFHNGTVLVVGHGYRSTKESVAILQNLIYAIYKMYDILPPIIIPVKLKRHELFHLQMAMMDFSQTECIIHKNSIRIKDLLVLQETLGHGNIRVIDVDDPFCLSSIVLEDRIISHCLSNSVKKILNDITKKDIIEIDMSEYEKGGGSPRALVFDLFNSQPTKRKKISNSNPSSPK